MFLVMKQNYPDEAECKRVGPRLERIVEQIVAYAHRKRFVGSLIEELDERISDLSDYPEEWASMVFAMLGAASVTTVSKRSQGFIRAARNDLAPADLQLAKQWRRVPWAFVAFEDLEPAEHDVVLVDPIGEAPPGWPTDIPWDRLPIYSRSLTDAYSRGVRCGLALVAYDGTVFHTYGVILLFPSFDARDLIYFASIAADDSTAGELPFLLGTPEHTPSISAVIRTDPVSFLMLFRWQDIPTVTGRRGPWRYCVSVVTYEGDENLADESMWRRVISEGGGVIQDIVVTDEIVGLRLGDETPMYEPLVLVSLEDRVIYIRAMTEEAYVRGVAAIASLVTIPAQPQVDASMTMMQAAADILHPVDLVSDLEAYATEAFDAAPFVESDGDLLEDGQTPPDFSVIQPVMDLLMESFNEGRTYTDEMIADKTGAEVEQVRMLREQVMKIVDGIPDGNDPSHIPKRPDAPGTGVPPATVDRRAADRVKPADRFDLPPGPFRRIMSAPIPAEEGVLALRDLRGEVLSTTEQEALLAVPLFRFARWMRDLKEIPATAAGYVAPVVVRRAIDEGIIAAYHDGFGMDMSDGEAPKKELDAPVFNQYREILEAANLIRLDGKRFVVNSRMKNADLGTIVSTIAEAMFTKVRWDDTRYDAAVPRLRESAGFLLYVLKRLSADESEGWVPVNALYDAFLGACPEIADAVTRDSSTPDTTSPNQHRRFGSVGWWVFLNVRVNFVNLFAETLGVIESDTPDARQRRANGALPNTDPLRVRPSPQFSIIFR